MKTIDYCIKKTALEKGVSEEEARVVVMTYWNEIYTNLISGSETAITVRHVGTFTMSRYKLNRFIIKKIQKIRSILRLENFDPVKKEEWLEWEKGKLKKALVHRNNIAKQYAESFGNI